MRLSSDQIKLQTGHQMRGARKTVKRCGRCGGKHAGTCNLTTTSHGTLCRPDIVEAVERRFRELRPVAA